VRTEKAYAPFSVAFEHPKSSLPAAQAVPLSAGNITAAASIRFQNQRFMFASVHSIRPVRPTSD
jgi:hypothetical protein